LSNNTRIRKDTISGVMFVLLSAAGKAWIFIPYAGRSAYSLSRNPSLDKIWQK